MKQIIINITQAENGKHSIILNCTQDDDSKIIKVVQPETNTDKDAEFVESLKILIQNYKG